ncbi:MAG: Acyl-CoA dehydrogenase [Ilumatobacteraceae bacterium]|nr:Acyl-CoA dehydrogenase [Ilumatobacteraceae bacterium]
MDIEDSPEEAAFRAEARAWLGANAKPRDLTTQHRPANTDAEQDAHAKRCREWQRVLYDGGWAGLTWPKQFGGRGGKPWQAAIFAEEQATFDVSTGVFSVAHGMVAPTLMVHGNDRQRAHLDAMLRGDEIWAQLFSEPEAGSDLANLGTRAVLDGDQWVVNGQKVWTSGAQHSQYAILLARTDPDAPKHAGITYFLVDMHTPGIEVRPLRQITGAAHFNEVFLTDVRIPVENVVGEVNAGWKIAHTTLSNERALIGGSGGNAYTIPELIDLARRYDRNDDPVIRQGLAQAHIRAEVLKYMGYGLRTSISRGEMPGPGASVMKLFIARHWSATTDLAVAIEGASGMLWGESATEDGRWQTLLCQQYAIRIGGGTDEIQGNVIGERALGLPREPALDRDLPWRETRGAR